MPINLTPSLGMSGWPPLRISG